MKIFIDTNIFLDALLKRDPFKIYAEDLLNLCDERTFVAFTSCVSFTNITYFVQHFNKSSYNCPFVKPYISLLKSKIFTSKFLLNK